jgi:hypothetical protein
MNIVGTTFTEISQFANQGPVVQKLVNFNPGLALTLG